MGHCFSYTEIYNNQQLLAELNELYLDNTPKAVELYKRIFMDYSSSTYSVQARKKFNVLSKDLQ